MVGNTTFEKATRVSPFAILLGENQAKLSRRSYGKFRILVEAGFHTYLASYPGQQRECYTISYSPIILIVWQVYAKHQETVRLLSAKKMDLSLGRENCAG